MITVDSPQSRIAVARECGRVAALESFLLANRVADHASFAADAKGGCDAYQLQHLADLPLSLREEDALRCHWQAAYWSHIVELLRDGA